jgi:hypothetical protein
MPVKRRVGKHRDIVTTQRAVELFVEMRPLHRRCTCPPPASDRLWKARSCDACRQWRSLQGDLNDELRCKPWIWPVIRETRAQCSDQPWSGTNRSWPSQRELWDMLAAAAEAAKASDARPEPNALDAGLS